FLLRQGKPANDVAVYLPTDDARTQFTAGRDSVDRSMNSLLGPTLVPQILDAGYISISSTTPENIPTRALRAESPRKPDTSARQPTLPPERPLQRRPANKARREI